MTSNTKQFYLSLGIALGYSFREDILDILEETGLLTGRTTRQLAKFLDHPLIALTALEHVDANRAALMLHDLGKEDECTGTTSPSDSSSDPFPDTPSKISTGSRSSQGCFIRPMSSVSTSLSREWGITKSRSTTGRKKGSSTE